MTVAEPMANVSARKGSEVDALTIVLVDDHQLIRQGLRSLIERQPDMKVLGEASDGRAGVAMVAELQPRVVVLDVSMPELNGIDAMRQLAALPKPPHVIGLSMHQDAAFAREMLRAGAVGYLLKDAAFDDLVAAIRAADAGQQFLSPAIAAAVGDGAASNGAAGANARNAFNSISPREREVLQLMAEGKATKEIAMVLHVSVKTVETHRRQLMEKLQLFSVAELTKYAIRQGVTSVE